MTSSNVHSILLLIIESGAMQMRIILISLIATLLILVGCVSKSDVSKYDGIMTDEKVELMQKAWCEYNEGKDIVTNQCDNY